MLALTIGVVLAFTCCSQSESLPPDDLESLPKCTMVGHKLVVNFRLDISKSFQNHLFLIIKEAKETEERLFGAELPEIAVVEIVSLNEYNRLFPFVHWSSGMYTNGVAYIPITATTDINALKGIIRHEFSHITVGQLSGSMIPAWLDEGLAQMQEPRPIEEINRFTTRWLSTHENRIIPLHQLVKGFSRIEDYNEIAAAYGFSYHATKLLIEVYGVGALREYFTAHTENTNDSFEKTFGVTQSEWSEFVELYLTAPDK